MLINAPEAVILAFMLNSFFGGINRFVVGQVNMNWYLSLRLSGF